MKWYSKIGFGVFVLLIFLIILTLVLTGCGNEDWSLGNFNFRKIHCTVTNECYEVISWRNCETGIEVKTREYGSLFFSEGIYILVEHECPICDK